MNLKCNIGRPVSYLIVEIYFKDFANVLLLTFQALVGTTITIPTIDGRKIPVRLSEVIKPTSTRRIQGEGLPLPKQSTRRGDMIIEFDIQFPSTLSTNAKETLANTLPSTNFS